ncbi:MAG: hypothetical protein JXA21_23360 [Anaerolineae bacterium]|nr:hypothetical protein [Anaerolineae bacterium]
MPAIQWDKVQQRFTICVVFLFFGLWLGRENPAWDDLKPNMDRLTARYVFNFTSWELEALVEKALFGLLAPQRFMDEEQQSRFVLAYLDDVSETQQLANEIDRTFTDPEIADPQAASQEQQTALAQLRDNMTRSTHVAEAILGEQVSTILNEGGFGPLQQILPPVSGTFTPLPYLLILSRRNHIETIYQQQLIAGLTAAEQEALEQQTVERFPSYSAYITGIGGLAVYPAMLLESTSIDWIADVVAHEWTHHYLLFHPLGLYYSSSGETRAINETSASLIGEWAGQEVILRFYDPLLERQKGLPNPLRQPPATTSDPPPAPEFDFRAEMYHTRVIVDQLLAENKIKDAEWYMEARRRVFVARGYRLRKLNQAYFAFHGAYAASPGGAAGADPIGPAVRRLWAISATPHDFIRTIAPHTTLAEVTALAPETTP